jgi:hypothetical protein
MFLGPRRPICTDAWPSRNLACRASWTLVLGSYIHLCTARAWCKRGPPKNKPGQAPCATQGRPPARNNARTRDELSSSARSAFTRLNEEWIMAYVPDLRILRSGTYVYIEELGKTSSRAAVKEDKKAGTALLLGADCVRTDTAVAHDAVVPNPPRAGYFVKASRPRATHTRTELL